MANARPKMLSPQPQRMETAPRPQPTLSASDFLAKVSRIGFRKTLLLQICNIFADVGADQADAIDSLQDILANHQKTEQKIDDAYPTYFAKQINEFLLEKGKYFNGNQQKLIKKMGAIYVVAYMADMLYLFETQEDLARKQLAAKKHEIGLVQQKLRTVKDEFDAISESVGAFAEMTAGRAKTYSDALTGHDVGKVLTREGGNNLVELNNVLKPFKARKAALEGEFKQFLHELKTAENIPPVRDKKRELLENLRELEQQLQQVQLPALLDGKKYFDHSEEEKGIQAQAKDIKARVAAWKSEFEQIQKDLVVAKEKIAKDNADYKAHLPPYEDKDFQILRVLFSPTQNTGFIAALSKALQTEKAETVDVIKSLVSFWDDEPDAWTPLAQDVARTFNYFFDKCTQHGEKLLVAAIEDKATATAQHKTSLVELSDQTLTDITKFNRDIAARRKKEEKQENSVSTVGMFAPAPAHPTQVFHVEIEKAYGHYLDEVKKAESAVFADIQNLKLGVQQDISEELSYVQRQITDLEAITDTYIVQTVSSNYFRTQEAARAEAKRISDQAAERQRANAVLASAIAPLRRLSHANHANPPAECLSHSPVKLPSSLRHKIAAVITGIGIVAAFAGVVAASLLAASPIGWMAALTLAGVMLLLTTMELIRRAAQTDGRNKLIALHRNKTYTTADNQQVSVQAALLEQDEKAKQQGINESSRYFMIRHGLITVDEKQDATYIRCHDVNHPQAPVYYSKAGNKLTFFVPGPNQVGYETLHDRSYDAQVEAAVRAVRA